MEPTPQERLLARAIANDDPYPDDICPGCQRKTHSYAGRCPWNRDFYQARRYRRQYIKDHAPEPERIAGGCLQNS